MRNEKIKAVIYTRGHSEKMQEVVCRLYAIEKKYDVVYVTKNIKDVDGCDILLITDPSRISRNGFEYYKTVKKLKDKGIKIENTLTSENADDYISLLDEIKKNV